MEKFTKLEILEDYVNRGLLRKAEDKDLVQYNYSERCNNEELWDDITLFNRGNIYEKSSGKLIAKSMPKFFNFSQLNESEQKHFLTYTKYVNTEKLDGCLGIIYKYKGEIRYNSRGGFNNYVTDTIKKILPKYNLKKLSELLDNRTFNVEVISPSTKIICDYKNEENLYLISAFTNVGYWIENSMEELDLYASLVGLPRPKYDNKSWEELFNWQKISTYQTEGFVVAINSMKYGAFERVKIKSDDYLRIAKFKAGLNKRSVWKRMKNDLEQGTRDIVEYINALPDELSNVAKSYFNEIIDEMNSLEKEANILANKLKDINTKDLSKYFKENPNKLNFCIYNIRQGKSIRRTLIKLVEPGPGFEDTVKLLEEE